MHLYETYLMKIYICINHKWNVNIYINIQKIYICVEHIWKVYICITDLEYKQIRKI